MSHGTAPLWIALAVLSGCAAIGLHMTPGGGYGTLYGPAVGIGGVGMIAGHEYLALTDSARRITMMVQVPDSFGIGQTCIVTAPSSGSRGVYGAIATAGEWGLKRGCAGGLYRQGHRDGLFPNERRADG